MSRKVFKFLIAGV